LRDALRSGASRDPSGLEHHDGSATEPRRVEQRERYERRLTGTRRSLYDERPMRLERRADRIENGLDRERRRYSE